MNKNTIELSFTRSTSFLAGNPYGKSVFEDQAKDKFDYNAYNIIVFPDNIKRVASSFTQGFFAEVVAEIGYAEFDKYVKIQAGDSVLENNIRKDLFV